MPGANFFSEKPLGPHVGEIEKIFVVVEPDTGGETVLRHIEGWTFRDRAHLVRLPVKDASALHVEDPQAFSDRFDAALEEAEPWIEYSDRTNDTQHQEAWDACRDIAESEDILARFVRAIGQCGVVGEDKVCLLIYLSLTSRFLRRPVSIAIKGTSSGGKSFSTDQTLQFFPQTAYCDLSGIWAGIGLPLASFVSDILRNG